jgi:hypothetical protein
LARRHLRTCNFMGNLRPKRRRVLLGRDCMLKSSNHGCYCGLFTRWVIGHRSIYGLSVCGSINDLRCSLCGKHFDSNSFQGFSLGFIDSMLLSNISGMSFLSVSSATLCPLPTSVIALAESNTFYRARCATCKRYVAFSSRVSSSIGVGNSSRKLILGDNHTIPCQFRSATWHISPPLMTKYPRNLSSSFISLP